MDQVTMIQVVSTIDVTATLMGIEFGEWFMCPNKLIHSDVVRSIASRLKKSRRASFVVKNCQKGVMIRRCAL